MNKYRKWWIALLITTVVIVSLGGAITFIIAPADEQAVAALDDSQVTPHYRLFLAEGTPRAALVFYTGGFVHRDAYAPLAADLASEGVAVYLLDIPLSIGFLGINNAQFAIYDIDPAFPILLAGHSLGGVTAVEFITANPNAGVDGLVLLASYPAADLSSTQLPTLSIVGSVDGVLNQDAYDASKSKWSPLTTEIVIHGGNHAQFGNYGPQRGDSEATISTDEQRQHVVEAILALVRVLEDE